MSFGFLGIQFGWALQMANMSAIYEYLGAEAHQIPILWLAAPLTGLVVQPVVTVITAVCVPETVTGMPAVPPAPPQDNPAARRRTSGSTRSVPPTWRSSIATSICCSRPRARP